MLLRSGRENRPVGFILDRDRSICQAIGPDGPEYAGPVGSVRGFCPGGGPVPSEACAAVTSRCPRRRSSPSASTSRRCVPTTTCPIAVPDPIPPSRFPRAEFPRAELQRHAPGRGPGGGGEPRAPGPRSGPVGARAVVGEVARGRRQDDQRPGRDAADEQRVQAAVRAPPLHRPRRRFLRMADDRGPQGSSAVVHQAPRRRADRVRRPLVDLARPQARRRRAPYPVVHDHHDASPTRSWNRSTTGCR